MAGTRGQGALPPLTGVLRDLVSPWTARKRKQRNTAARAPDFADYLYLRDHVAQDLLDRLNDITREFPVAADIGAGACSIARHWDGHGDIQKLYCVEYADGMLMHGRHMFEREVGEDDVECVPVVAEEEFLPFAPGSLDLCMSCLSLHWVNDIEEALKQIRRSLKPDGAFVGALLGGDTLGELRSSFVAADLERRGGVSPHVSPMIEVSDVGALLSSAGFTMPTVDTHTITVNYSDAMHLMEHLQGMGDSGALMKGDFASQDLMLAAASAYKAMFGEDDCVPATFQVVYMIGWAPHESQRKPLPRGSATHSMKDIMTQHVADA